MYRLLIVTGLLFMTLVNGQGREKPNVILIMTDDQSWDSLGFMGGKVHTTVSISPTSM
jgi:hypothetical protein